MKPIELIKYKDWWNVRGHAEVERRFQRYQDKNCVVAYLKENLGTIFIIKSARKYYAFVHLNPEVYFGGYDYKMAKISLKLALDLMGEDVIIVDKELFGNLNKYMILEALC